MKNTDLLESVKRISDDEHLINLISNGNYREAKQVLFCLRGSYYDSGVGDHWKTLFNYVIGSLDKQK